ncbi:MAG TPA: hypothetical protein VN540_07625 [Clostridia bacterium]|nr:hypothetical protein [Clostridia bacterium]
MGFKERIARFMQGRNGPDSLSRACSVTSIVVLVAAIILQSAGAKAAGSILWYFALALIAVCYWRMLSKNITKRYRENVWYLNLRDRFLGFFRREFAHVKQLKTHRFFRCPSCKQRVRTPRGKGKIRVTCPKCGASFIRRS